MNEQKTVRAYLLDFYKENNFGDDGGVSKSWVWIKFGFFSIPIPNAKSRKSAIFAHDLHHLVTQNNTTWKGESAVSAWEIAAGGWSNLYFPWLLTLWALGVGVLFYPSHTAAAFRKGLTMKNVLFLQKSQQDIFDLKVEELIILMSNHPQQNKSIFFWFLMGVIVFLSPFLMLAAIIFLSFYLI